MVSIQYIHVHVKVQHLLYPGYCHRKIFSVFRGRPFDSEGGGGLTLFGNKYSDLDNAGNK